MLEECGHFLAFREQSRSVFPFASIRVRPKQKVGREKDDISPNVWREAVSVWGSALLSQATDLKCSQAFLLLNLYFYEPCLLRLCTSFFFLIMFIYFWERERKRERENELGRGQREGDTESQAGSRLWAVSAEPDAGLEPTEHKIVIWSEIKSQTLNWLSHPGSPKKFSFYVIKVMVLPCTDICFTIQG